MKLAIGMTVGARRETKTVYEYCSQAVSSLRRVGFTEELHCFIEPDAEGHVPDHSRWNIVPHVNAKTLGCFLNFKHGLDWLLKTTDADWFLMLQDDCVWRADGAQLVHAAIERPDMQDAGFLSPYTSKAMVEETLRVPEARWASENLWAPCRFHNRAFWGAVSMLFPRRSATLMNTQSQRYLTHRHHRKLDVVVGNAMRAELNLPIYVHVPSLCEHIGSFSTLGRHRFKGNRWGRRGFLFRET